MLRKTFAAAALGLAALSPLAAPQTARADHWERHERYYHHHHRHFEVFYRRDCHCEWRCAGNYGCWEEAEHAACNLRARGFEVSIRD
jgi:hypothetical protein